jgi:uncharacterized protein (DUF2236 family)
MSGGDQDRYYAQLAVIARKLHAAPVPETRSQAADLMLTTREHLLGSAEAREVARYILSPQGTGPPPPNPSSTPPPWTSCRRSRERCWA